MTNKQACEAFAQGQSGSSDNIYSTGRAIFSYGGHFPMAVRKDGKLYVNKDKYSNTTSRHMFHLRSAIEGQEYELRSTKELIQMV